MILPSTEITITEVTDTTITAETANGQVVTFDKAMIENAAIGMKLQIAADSGPLKSGEKHAKEVLNELLKS